jgi:hypothetical protein
MGALFLEAGRQGQIPGNTPVRELLGSSKSENVAYLAD